ncbi:MAG TPA: DedA family protein [Bacteroidales bacterium]|nr:DedA family protein [Bacteroidales bacterium]
MLDGFAEYGYWGLFLASFLAATILPFSSEVVFAALIASGLDVWSLILFATIGNSLGGASCYYLGRLGKTEWLKRWFRISEDKIARTTNQLQGKGAFMGFFGFLPAVGDAILVALGYMRANSTLVLISMTIGKFARYIIIGYWAGIFISWF